MSAKEAREKLFREGVVVNESPVACSGVDPANPIAGLSVTFNATGSYDPDGSGGINGISKFEWDWENDGTYDHIETYPCDGVATHTFTLTGQKTVKIRVTDGEGAKDTTTRTFDVGNVIYVDVDSYPFHDGTTWERAFVDLQDALDIASSGNEIWVAEGTYVLSSGMSINKAISIYGGFDGTETTLGDRDSFPGNTHTTTVDGDNIGNIRCFNITDCTTIDGFTITNAGTDYFDPGTGIYCSGGSTTITNCNITNNGKGISCDLSSSSTISNCTFSGNGDVYFTEYSGGGIGISSSSSPTITNCEFSQNIAGGIGCGSSSGTISISDCEFNSNSSGSGGAIGCFNSSPTISNCVFTGNGADGGVRGDGGAIHIF